jgi:hypothetical protein
MNHQPFRDWLLTDEKLSAEQITELKTHLASCESCQQTDVAWSEVESTFHKVPLVQPTPGFTNRWQIHLAEYLENKKKRRTWMMIGLNVVIIISLFGFLVTQLWSLIQSPGPYLVMMFTRLFSLVSIFYAFQDIFSSFSRSVPLYMGVGMFFLVGIVCFMSVLWMVTYQKLSISRRII